MTRCTLYLIVRNRRFSRYAWAVLALNLLVILWGAVVRATGSGAGCGSHWPQCNGAIVPLDAGTETTIEFVHRATSGLAGVAVFVLVVWAWRAFAPRSQVRLAAVAAGVLIVVESLFGAALVVFEWTGDDASNARAAAIAVHLVNTLLLIGALTLTAWLSTTGERLSPGRDRSFSKLVLWGLVAMMVLGATGAVTALGDTLFPAESLADGLRQDLSPTANFMIRLRVVHPVLAIATGIYLAWLARHHRQRAPRPADVVVIIVAVQILAGFVNVALLAPVGLQLVHLLLADLLWIATVVFGARVLAATPALLDPDEPSTMSEMAA